MIRVVFIAGCWRSGSTLLGDLLGALPGFCHVGELHHAWRRGLQLDWLCGCGAPFRSCAFWTRALTDWGGADRASELEDARRRMATETPALASPETVRARYPEYVEALGRLADAVCRASGGRALVDSTKNVQHACALVASGRVELRAVHLIRDPRATVFSLVQRPKPHLDDPNGSAMLQPSVEDAVRFWLDRNREAERFARLARGSVTLRYEDLARDPTGALRTVVQLAGGEELAGEALVADVPIPASHTISGNPDRLTSEARRRIVVDDEWSGAIAPATRAFVEQATRDWMERYGYA